MGTLSKNLSEQQNLIKELYVLDDLVDSIANLISVALKNGSKLMICGNGGSAADSQHIAAEFTGRFVKDRMPISAMALTTDTSALTCISNDYSFDDVFSRQIIALGRPGDCLLCISTSGNSRNIIKAANISKQLGIYTVGLLGRDGGELKNTCDASIIVPSFVTARIQEAHILIGHTLCEMVENYLFQQ